MCSSDLHRRRAVDVGDRDAVARQPRGGTAGTADRDARRRGCGDVGVALTPGAFRIADFVGLKADPQWMTVGLKADPQRVARGYGAGFGPTGSTRTTSCADALRSRRTVDCASQVRGVACRDGSGPVPHGTRFIGSRVPLRACLLSSAPLQRSRGRRIDRVAGRPAPFASRILSA